MQLNQVAAQLYTIRDFLKTPEEIARSLQRVREIGYTAVQVSGLGPIEPAALRRLLDASGLVCCATHEDPRQILDEPAALIDKLRTLGCATTAYPFPADVNMHDEAAVRALAQSLNKAGEVLHRAEITLSYHNHHLELVRLGQRTALELIYAETEPQFLGAEIDTYWIQYGGGTPQDWCARLKGRLHTIHMKDYGLDDKLNPVFREVGSGNLNWPEIIRAAEGAGCRWFIVEQDTCPGDPFDSLHKSFEFIKQHLVVA